MSEVPDRGRPETIVIISAFLRSKWTRGTKRPVVPEIIVAKGRIGQSLGPCERSELAEAARLRIRRAKSGAGSHNSYNCRIDNDQAPRYCFTHKGECSVRRGFWTFILLLLTAIVCVSAIPRADVPETSYNEADAPVNQAPPVVLGIRFVRPAKAALVVPRKTVEATWHVLSPVDERKPASVLVVHDAHSLQDILCTLLI